MALSWIYAAFGNVGVVEALFFGLKAAVLAIVLEAVMRIGRRALKNNVMLGLAAAAFVAIFAFDVPFPLIILTAALIGYRRRASRPARIPDRRQRPRQARQGGSRRRDRARRKRTCARASLDFLVAARLGHLPRALARAGRRAAAGARSGRRLHEHRRVLLEDGGGHLRRRLRGAGLRRAAGGRDLWLAAARRDAGRAWPCRDDARPADHGDPVRRLPWGLSRPGRAEPLRRRHPRRPAHHLGDLRAVLPLDLPGRAVRRDDSWQPGARGGARRDYGRGRRRRPQPGCLVWPARVVRRGARGRRLRHVARRYRCSPRSIRQLWS